MPRSSCRAPALGGMGTAGVGGPGQGVGIALGGDEVRVIDTAQQAVEEAGDASVLPGAGRGVNEWRRCTHSITSVYPRMAAAQGPVDPSSPGQSLSRRSSPLSGVRQTGRQDWGWGGGLSGLRQGGAGAASQRGKHQQK